MAHFNESSLEMAIHDAEREEIFQIENKPLNMGIHHRHTKMLITKYLSRRRISRSITDENRNSCKSKTYSYFLVPRPGVEPGRIAPLVFETSASTDSAIWAYKRLQRYE